MKQVLVIYDTTFGNTKRLAKEIAFAIEQAGEITCTVTSHKHVDFSEITVYDAVLFGSPIHAGMATRGIKGAIKKAAKIGLADKIVSTFDTNASVMIGRGVKNMEKLLSKVASDARMISPGLSSSVKGFRGPLNDEEIPKAHEFGRMVGEEILKA